MRLPERITILFLLVSMAMLFLFVSATTIQVLNSESYQKKAESKALSNNHVYAKRGKIMDRNGKVLADIAPVKDPYWQYPRIYPQGHLASQILGKVGHNGSGSAGIEEKFDEKLRGRTGLERITKDKNRRQVHGFDQVMYQANPGDNLVLTIDIAMQELVEKALKDGVEEFKALSASAVILDPYSGDILAASTYPTFDPNAKKSHVRKCDIFSLAYEPGSTFKVVTAMAALQENIVDPASVWHGEKGAWKVGHGIVIREHDSKDLGDMDMSMALAKSSNVVFAKIADSVGEDNFYKFVRNFGFGSKATDEIQGEETGHVRKPYEWSGRSLMTMGFGHEFLATPIQVASAFAAVANGGLLMKPRVVKEWRDSLGTVLEKNEPYVVRRMVSEDVAAKLREMLQGVVQSGTALRVNSKILPGIEFSGKTGTAEKYSAEKKGYDRKRQVASFVGLAPSVNPQYVCMVLLDEPQTRTAGGVTAGPIFRRIMEAVYMHPELSPKTYRLQNLQDVVACDIDVNGKDFVEAEKMANSRSCHLETIGTGEKIISAMKLSSDSLRVVLGSEKVFSMPELKGLSLKDALAILAEAHVPVEFVGKGRIVEQYPEANSKLEKGQVCKLVLKENV